MQKLREYKTQLILAALAFVAVLIGFRAMLFNHLPGVFNAVEEDLAYGWYVPVFSLYVLWTERQKLVDSLGRPSLGAAFALIPFLCLGLLGARGLQVRFELVAFVGLLIFGTWAFFGRAAMKQVLFPALFLLFCTPLASFLAVVTVPLRLLVSSISAGLLSGFGMELVRHGNVIDLTGVMTPEGKLVSIDIANPCSGLRSIFALLAIAAGYGYFTQPTWIRRGILFVLAVPLAILGNIVRIVTICCVAKAGHPSFALGGYHDLSGYLVFLVAVGLLVCCSDLLTRLCSRKRAEEDDGTRRGAASPNEVVSADAGNEVSPLGDEVSPLGDAAPRRVPSSSSTNVIEVSPLGDAAPRRVPSSSSTNVIEVSPLGDAAPRRVPSSSATSAGVASGLSVSGRLALVLAFVLLVVSMSYQALTPKPFVPEAPNAVIPERLVLDLQGQKPFVGLAVAPSEAETNILINAGASISRRSFRQFLGFREVPQEMISKEIREAAAAAGKTIKAAQMVLSDSELFTVSTVVSGENKGSMHRPELCLPSNGGQMTASRELMVDDVEWKVIALSGSTAVGPNGEKLETPPMFYAYTFYNQDGYRTSSHVVRIARDTWDRTVHNRVDRWVMVAVQLNGQDETLLNAVLRAVNKDCVK